MKFLWLAEDWVTEAVRAAFEAVPFEAMTRLPDGTIITQTTAPEMMARMLAGLDVRPGMTVLEIGTGSGYNAALLRELTGEEGKVVSVEVFPDVSAAAQKRLSANGYRDVICIAGDGWLGCEAFAPYDRIIAATKPPHIPEHWVHQLAPGGILVTPIDHSDSPTGTMIAYLRKEGETLIRFDEHVGGFIPMTRDPGNSLYR